jgi:hypothetical protein
MVSEAGVFIHGKIKLMIEFSFILLYGVFRLAIIKVNINNVMCIIRGVILIMIIMVKITLIIIISIANIFIIFITKGIMGIIGAGRGITSLNIRIK